MKRLILASIFLILSCQTKSGSKSSSETPPTPGSDATASVVVGARDVCVRIENCSSGIDIPKTCGPINDKIVPGSEHCKLKLVSFPYLFGTEDVTVNLSLDERDRLANAEKGEGIETHIKTQAGAHYIVSISVVDKFPEKPIATSTASFNIKYQRQGNKVAINDVQVKTAESEFLKACLKDPTARRLNVGEKNLLTLIKSRYGVTCRDMHAALSLQDELIFFNSSDAVQALDFNILAEFKNIARLQIDSFFPITLASGHAYDELTFGTRQMSGGGPAPEGWLLDSNGATIKKLIFDHVRFTDRTKEIRDYIVILRPTPLAPLNFHVEELTLKNVAHQNFNGLNSIGLTKLSIENTYLYDTVVFTGGPLIIDGHSDQAAGNGLITVAECNSLQGLKECLFNNCIYTNSNTCTTNDHGNPLPTGDISKIFSGIFCDRSEKAHWEYSSGTCKRKCEGSNQKKCALQLLTNRNGDCTWGSGACYTTECRRIQERADCIQVRPATLEQCNWDDSRTPKCHKI